MLNLKKTLMVGAAAVAFTGLAACTSQQEQNFINSFQAICASLAAGETFAIQVTSSIPTIAPFAQTVGPIVQAGTAAACGAFVAGAQSVIEAINNAGGTAKVTAATTSPSQSAMIGALVHHYGVPAYHSRRTLNGVTQDVWTFVVPPRPNWVPLPFGL
jgi:hypothetical protein